MHGLRLWGREPTAFNVSGSIAAVAEPLCTVEAGVGALSVVRAPMPLQVPLVVGHLVAHPAAVHQLTLCIRVFSHLQYNNQSIELQKPEYYTERREPTIIIINNLKSCFICKLKFNRPLYVHRLPPRVSSACVSSYCSGR